MVNVRDFGATGDGVTDDHVALQAALVAGAGGDVYVPIGTYITSVALAQPAGTMVRGEDRALSVIKQAAGVGPSIRILLPTGAGCVITNITLDGNRANQTADEHRCGVMATGAPGVILRSVTLQNFTGDGVYIYNGSNAFVIDDVLATNNDRNGITLGGNTVGGLIENSQFVASKAQQVDSEPPSTWTVDNVTIRNCTIDGMGQSGNNYVLTVCGGSATAMSSGWIVEDNVINGPVATTFAKRIRIANNVGTNTTPMPSVSCLRTNEDITVESNRFAMTQTSTVSASIVYVGGAGPGATTLRARIVRNELTATGLGAVFGVRCEGARSVEILDNILRGPGLAAAGYAGIWIRATIPTEDFRSAVIQRNTIRDWGALAITISGAGAPTTGPKLLLLDIRDNIFDDATGTMIGALSLDDTLHSAKDIRLGSNTMLGGCVTMIVHAATGTHYDVSGDRWIVP